MRTLIILLVLATTALGHAGSWQAVRYGNDETKEGTGGTVTGNAINMDVIAHTVVTLTDVFCMTDPLSADQDGAGSDMDTVWYELTFAGDSQSTNHTWAIETNIHGTGAADADVKIQGTAIVEALHAIMVTGNHDNKGSGQLGAADTSGVKYSLKPPTEFGISLENTVLSISTDNFTTKKPKKTTGAGTKCRIRIDTNVQARGSASTVIGHSSATILGELRVDVVMTGSCTFAGIPVKDTFRIGSGGISAPSASETRPPSGGVVTKREIPTDTPEEDVEDEEAGDDEPDLPAPPPEDPSTGDDDPTNTVD